MPTTADLKRGLVIQLDNAPCLVLDVTSQSPSARGGSTLVKIKYRNLLTGQVLDKAYKSGERVDAADFEKRKGQFLYATGDDGVFMYMFCGHMKTFRMNECLISLTKFAIVSIRKIHAFFLYLKCIFLEGFLDGVHH
ncbi:MAG: hypothetical protein C0617_04795 [Desulfuromonas sp.]|nr:hypothetical protein [Desulfuromonas sp.]PLX85389.1 MAG: hypothetical protein C0617_04795 [Desulfuromonas sp.]